MRIKNFKKKLGVLGASFAIFAVSKKRLEKK